MNQLLFDYRVELLQTLLTLAILFALRLATTQMVRRVGKISDISRVRTRLIIKYVNIAFTIVAAFIISIIWSVNFKELGLLLSSIFAVLGVALFAQWSILSNVTSGVILFFSFPYKIGDRIKIQDKDFPNETVIEDIKAFHINLRADNGELITYPNNLLLQKGVVIIEKYDQIDDGADAI
jgi:small-conductance mechanosensitive channel